MIPSKEEIKISAAIIAGGANKRFNGKTKANIQISGVRIITRAIKTLYEIFGDIVIVTNTPDEFKTCHDSSIVFSSESPSAYWTIAETGPPEVNTMIFLPEP